MPKHTVFPTESAPACQHHLIQEANNLITQHRFSEAADLALASELLLAGDYSENPLAAVDDVGLPYFVLTRNQP